MRKIYGLNEKFVVLPKKRKRLTKFRQLNFEALKARMDPYVNIHKILLDLSIN